MLFSKSFGYAIRGVLYISLMQDEKKYVQAEEIASRLAVPRHFMSKILKKLVKTNVLSSIKGPSGGFTINQHTLKIPLIEIVDLTDGLLAFKNCVLKLNECNAENPCPLHYQVEGVKTKLKSILSETTIGDLLKDNKIEFIKSISTNGLDIDIIQKPLTQKL